MGRMARMTSDDAAAGAPEESPPSTGSSDFPENALAKISSAEFLVLGGEKIGSCRSAADLRIDKKIETSRKQMSNTCRAQDRWLERIAWAEMRAKAAQESGVTDDILEAWDVLERAEKSYQSWMKLHHSIDERMTSLCVARGDDIGAWSEKPKKTLSKVV